MKKTTKAVIAGLTFLAGCEIGLSIQLYRTIKKFIVEEEAMKAPGLRGDETVPEDEEVQENAEIPEEVAVPEDETEEDITEKLQK